MSQSASSSYKGKQFTCACRITIISFNFFLADEKENEFSRYKNVMKVFANVATAAAAAADVKRLRI
jgi:hypothetical protein